MQFVNNKQSMQMNVYNQRTYTPAIMPFSKKYTQNPSVPPTTNNTSISSQIEEPKKMKWGEPTWFLFHTIAYKVKDDKFDLIRDDLFKIMLMICTNLPCPMCSAHATAYMKNINVNMIRTKRDLIDLFYNFHNEVNQRKDVPIFPYSELDSKYANAVTVNIIHHFMHFYQDKSFSIHMIATELHRSRLIRHLKEWFTANIQYFDA